MSKRKIMLLAAALVMVAVLGIGGTLAYFTDEDTKTNVFTVGNVDIHIDEWMDLEGDKEWEEYDDEQELWPSIGNRVPFNKLVETVNDGTEDAYIRTFVTCPKDMYDYLGLGFNSGASATIGTNQNGNNMYPVTWKDVGTFMINGEETSVFLCEVKDHAAVKAGESVLSLTKVWLYETVTNEVIESFKLEKGEDIAESMFKVEVASQAIQTAHLTYEEAMAELGAINQDLMDKLFN